METEHIWVKVGSEGHSRLCEHPNKEDVARSLVLKGFHLTGKQLSKLESDDGSFCEDCFIELAGGNRG